MLLIITTIMKGGRVTNTSSHSNLTIILCFGLYETKEDKQSSQ